MARDCSEPPLQALDRGGRPENADNEAVLSDPQTWMCLICGWIYDEAAGDPEHGLAPGTRWSDVDMNWTCPECGARKDDFEMVRI